MTSLLYMPTTAFINDMSSSSSTNPPYHHLSHHPSYSNPPTNTNTTSTRPRLTIPQILTLPNTVPPTIPTIPPDSVPNLTSIRKVYDIAFAPGLDKFLDSPNGWFSQHGFDLLASNRSLLGLVLAYLTLVSTHHDSSTTGPPNPTLVSQEARVVWAMLSLCTTPTPTIDDPEADTLARRFRTIESLLTGDPPIPSANTIDESSTTLSMSEFLHHQDTPDPEGPATVPSAQPSAQLPPSTSSQPPLQPTQLLLQQQLEHQEQLHAPTVSLPPFTTQLASRTEEFWSTLENIANMQNQPNGTHTIQSTLIPKLKTLLDNRENRDTLYAACLLGWGEGDIVGGSASGGGGGGGAGPGAGSGVVAGSIGTERDLARRFLQNQANGRGMGVVSASLAGMCLRGMETS